MGMGSQLYYGMDWTYLLIVVGFFFSLLVQGVMKTTFAKYTRLASRSGMTGGQVAEAILRSEGIYDVRVCHIRGSLTDHYDPGNKTVSLSDEVYGQRSIAALGVAAHECGHAIQDARGYAPLRIRSALVPLANFGAGISWWVFLAGLILSASPLLKVGILLFLFALAFQVVTLPVEFNASARALRKLRDTGIMAADEVGGARRVLSAAAMTYVAAACASLLQLARMLILANKRRDD